MASAPDVGVNLISGRLLDVVDAAGVDVAAIRLGFTGEGERSHSKPTFAFTRVSGVSW